MRGAWFLPSFSEGRIVTILTAATTTSSTGFADYLLLNLRCAKLRAALAVNEITAMGVALRAGLIDPDNALEHLADIGALDLVIPSSGALP